MPNVNWTKRIGLAAMAAGVGGLMLAAAPAGAQEDQYDDEYYASDDAAANDMSEDEVTVTAPRYRGRSEYGAPIRNVAVSREVRFDDLDLATEDGERTLRNRVRGTARLLCRQLDAMHPVAADDNPPCYENAVEEAMYQVDEAVDAARNYASEE